MGWLNLAEAYRRGQLQATKIQDIISPVIEVAQRQVEHVLWILPNQCHCVCLHQQYCCLCFQLADFHVQVKLAAFFLFFWVCELVNPFFEFLLSPKFEQLAECLV